MMKTVTGFHFDRFLLPAFLCLALMTPAFAQRPRSSAPRPAQSSAGYEKVAAEADRQREAGNLDEAIGLYQKAVALKPSWDEGWWYLATLLYERDRYEEAVRAFKQVARLRPQVGAPLAMQGLCEYKLARYDDAFLHLQQGRQRGVGKNEDLVRVMQYHEGTLFLLRGEYETAQRIFTALSQAGTNNQEFILAMGLAVLRISALPKDIDVNRLDRELIRRAGLAQHNFAQLNAADARIEYERLVKDFPTVPNLQYAYGRFLVDTRDDEGGIAAFEREIANSPTHALARLQIAFIRSRNKDAAAGIPLAEEAVKLHKRLPLGHYILGRLLFESGENPRAIEELEQAKKLAPDEPRIYYSLARAYAKANRREESERARETFARLNKKQEEAERRGDPRGDPIDEKEAEKPRP
ncbi:MAG: tetratricopeptide repeat protein [Blastocatellia bacterium]|nr:tetratricopeptide repeat protein [Blastocatellia bacterium]